MLENIGTSETMSKYSICQKAFMTLLLETVIMVSSVPEDGSSEAVNDVKSIAIKLVSHLVQVPSSATLFWDVLSLMPRNSEAATSGYYSSICFPGSQFNTDKSSATSLEIKLPLATEEIGERAPASVTNSSSREDFNEEKEDHASTSAAPTDSGEGNNQDWNDLTENSSSFISSEVESLCTLRGTEMIRT